MLKTLIEKQVDQLKPLIKKSTRGNKGPANPLESSIPDMLELSLDQSRALNKKIAEVCFKNGGGEDTESVQKEERVENKKGEFLA